MGELIPQKVYSSEEQRRKDQRGDKEPEANQGVFEMFNNWASDKTKGYRRDVFRRSAKLETRIENALDTVLCPDLKAEWQACRDELYNQRTELKVAHSDNVVKECFKASKLDSKVNELTNRCPF